MTTKANSRNVTAELAFLTRALKAPSLAASVNSTLSASRPLYSAGAAMIVCRVAPAGISCRL